MVIELLSCVLAGCSLKKGVYRKLDATNGMPGGADDSQPKPKGRKGQSAAAQAQAQQQQQQTL